MAIKKGIEDHKRGDTWDGIEIEIKEEDENGIKTPISLIGAELLAQFTCKGVVVFEFKTSDNTILVPAPETGIFYLAPRDMNVKADIYYFDIQMIYNDGNKTTIVPTHSWTILQDISS